MATLVAVQESEFEFIRKEPVVNPTVKPNSISEIDVSEAVLEDLALKTLYLAGRFPFLNFLTRSASATA